MKKSLLITAASVAISSSAFADMDQFYLRGDLLVHKFKNINDQDVRYNANLKSNFGIGFDFGIGTYVAENIRAEIIYTHILNPDHKFKGKIGIADVDFKSKAKADSITFRGLFDIDQFGPGKPYIGVGLGMARISSKFESKVLLNGQNYEGSIKTKNSNNLAYSLHLGYGLDISDNVKADFGYSFRDFGKTKKPKRNISQLPLSSHNLSAGIRFSI